jgi:hypothetical protein
MFRNDESFEAFKYLIIIHLTNFAQDFFQLPGASMGA